MLKELERANRLRNKEWDPEDKLDLTFFGVELAGECGEACNIIKKIEREKLGLRGSRATVEMLAEELADIVIVASLCAISAGVDLETAIKTKFNQTSDKNKLSVTL